jgi:hypothetical protein
VRVHKINKYYKDYCAQCYRRVITIEDENDNRDNEIENNNGDDDESEGGIESKNYNENDDENEDEGEDEEDSEDDGEKGKRKDKDKGEVDKKGNKRLTFSALREHVPPNIELQIDSDELYLSPAVSLFFTSLDIHRHVLAASRIDLGASTEDKKTSTSHEDEILDSGVELQKIITEVFPLSPSSLPNS